MSSHSSPSTDLLPCEFYWEHHTSCHFLLQNLFALRTNSVYIKMGFEIFLTGPQSTSRSLQDLWNSVYVPLLHLCTVCTSWKVLPFHLCRPLYSANSIFRTNATSSRKPFLIRSGKNYFYYLVSTLFAWSISVYLSYSPIRLYLLQWLAHDRCSKYVDFFEWLKGGNISVQL